MRNPGTCDIDSSDIDQARTASETSGEEPGVQGELQMG